MKVRINKNSIIFFLFLNCIPLDGLAKNENHLYSGRRLFEKNNITKTNEERKSLLLETNVNDERSKKNNYFNRTLVELEKVHTLDPGYVDTYDLITACARNVNSDLLDNFLNQRVRKAQYYLDRLMFAEADRELRIIRSIDPYFSASVNLAQAQVEKAKYRKECVRYIFDKTDKIARSKREKKCKPGGNEFASIISLPPIIIEASPSI